MDDVADFNGAWAGSIPNVVPHPAARAALPPAEPDPAKPAIWLDDAAWCEEQIEVRPWVVPGYFMRGAVTVLAGPGGAGKSSLMMGWSIAAALGESFGAFVPKEPCRVLIYNVEDDKTEQRRRLSAALRTFGRVPLDIAGKILRVGPTGLGTLIEHDQQLGRLHDTPALKELEAALRTLKPDLVILDPLAELHNGEENDNTVLRLVIARMRQIARDHDCAIGLLHHTRKGGTAGDVDAVRGASALVAAGRAAFTVFPMTAEEAEALGIAEKTRRSFVRVDSVKANYAAATEAAWHELVEHELDNGERIPAITPWRAPEAPKGLGVADEVLALLLAQIGRGTAFGPFSPRLSEKEPRSIALAMASHGIPAKRWKDTLLELLRRGVRVEPYRDSNRKEREGLRAANGAPVAKWSATPSETGAGEMFRDP